MKKSWILLTACAALLSGVEAIACTGLLVGKKASTDGSVMISYAADSHSLYGEMYRWTAATWPKGAMLEVKEWDTGKPLGKIAQVENTYSVVGNMNEHQVAITESTFGGRHELVDTTGICWIRDWLACAEIQSSGMRIATQTAPLLPGPLPIISITQASFLSAIENVSPLL